MGRGQKQQQAIAETLALPRDDSNRNRALELLSSLRITINVDDLITQEEEEQLSFMALSEAYLEWKREVQQEGIEQGIEQGQRLAVESLLRSRFNPLDHSLIAIIPAILELSPEEYMPLLLNLSQTELLVRFQPK